ncbi:unnamed protein product [Urochloa decumbens]|uniref:Disease resistance protein RPM1 n=1 Tax=Urochloa decumbens TaxID=240449 RepID=A0ABC9B4L8_9POAL
MADLVLGLAKSAVEGTLTAAKSAIEEEEKLKKGMQRDLMLISDEFEMMHSFLNVAKDRVTDKMVRTLVRQVRNMALDVEDCIESVVLTEIKSNWWRRLLRFCMLANTPASALDDAVAAAELLKSRVEAMGQRNGRYWHIREPGSKLTEKKHPQAVADAAAVGILIEAREAKTKQGTPKDLIGLINKIDHTLPLQLISLWGAVGDLGVASIIKKTCDDPEVCKKFRCRAWVKLIHPFNPQELIRSLLAQFYTNNRPQQGSSIDFLEPTDVMIATEGIVIEEFMKQVSAHRYLVFLEDVSSTVDWEAVRAYLPDKKNGSCIVVHTQQIEVASLCVGESHRVLELEKFSADHSVCVLFNEKKRSPRSLIELISMKSHAIPLQVISVFAPVGNLGLESIMKKTCDEDPEFCKIFRCRAWVKLMHPFNPHDFIRSLLAQMYTNYCSQHGSAEDFLKLNGMMIRSESVLREFVEEVMSNQRYLVFLEDLSSMEDWKAVREYLPDKKNGSCIIVHTQQPELAGLCVGQSHRVLELEQFSADHCVRVSFDEGQNEESENKTEDAMEWIEENQLVGRKVDISNLCVNRRGVNAVFGIAGVGKSYIVEHVYWKKVIEHNPFKKFGWVDVSHPFNIRDFSWSLLLDLHSGSLQHGNMLRIRDPIQECRELLRKHVCLIVIDDLQSTEEWDLIKDALNLEHDYRSRIIVITNKESVAAYCSSNLWNVEGLEIDEALDLFKTTASNYKPQPQSFWPRNPSPADIERAELVLHKCGGLPEVIVAVAEFAAAWNLWRVNWDYFMQVLENHPAFVSLRDLFSWVHSYFHSCADSLKPCIFYLSIFPANHKIRRRRLVQRWIAEGYSMDTKEKTAEEKGEEPFLDLCKLNMIQVPGSTSQSYLTRMPSCQVNGFFREYIVSRSMEENLVFALEGHCSVNSQRTGRHLTIGSTWDGDKSVYQSIEFSRLRSLTVFGQWESFFISEKMRMVRVLDLEDASSVTDSDLELMTKLLPRLKFLSLRKCKEVTRLPDTLGGLSQLQTLDIRHTSIVKLPVRITKLQKLQHICAGSTVPMDDDSTVESIPAPPQAASTSTLMTSRPRAHALLSKLWTRQSQRLSGSRNGGIEVPRGIGKMMALHNISVIDVSIASGRAILEELKNLTQLRKLGVSGINRENCEEFCSAISGHAHLKTLSVWLDKNQAGCLDAISLPPMKLQSLKLYGHVDKLPAWIKLLTYLRKLKLQMDMIMQNEVDLLMYLPCLNTLCLCSKEFQYGELRFRAPFRRLQVLEIDCNCRLETVTFELPAMPELEVLKIRCSNVSSLKFVGLQQLRNLREVSISGSYDDKVKQHLQSQLDEHQRETKPVLK